MRTVKVRIAIAIDPSGRWACAGGHNWAEDEAASSVIEFLDTSREVVHWVTAEVPVPDSLTIKGKLDTQ